MTSESDVLKTNEFLRRRKLRLQQVREQSKDIAKKIRQRAKVEKLRQTINLDAKKEKEYFDLQEKFVERLENLYSQSLENVGSSHNNATKALVEGKSSNQDISKLRGKEAAAELRKRKQEKLDEQKKVLDRKLHARETANELSRDKFATVAKTLSSKSSENIQKQPVHPIITEINNNPLEREKSERDTSKNDMATQWECDELPNEWGSSVPTLSLPKDDRDSLKCSQNEKSVQKRLNLFALSNEMPSSLRGGNSDIPIQASQQQSSVTLISEYLQNRNLRLRESRTNPAQKSDDLQSIKQTILRSRASKIDGNYTSVCHVLDKQLIPVPSWTAEVDSCACRHCHTRKSIQPVTNVHIRNSFQRSASPSTWTASKGYQRKYNNSQPVAGKCDKSVGGTGINKKPSVTMYNHSTRDTRDTFNDGPIIVREENTEDDAYLNALKETSITTEAKARELDKKKELLRSKVAVTRERVDQDYKDTLSFLNMISKEKTCRSHNRSHVDYEGQQVRNEKRQKKMQEEFRKIEKESRRTCKHKSAKRSESNADFVEAGRLKYDWMPVPEGECAVHTLPDKHSVKFDDTHTQYRSRHKHTPPTKQHPDREGVADESESSEKPDSDDGRIVVYKILDSKRKARRSKEERKDVETRDNTRNAESVTQLDLREGIYKVGENGDNITSTYFERNTPHLQAEQASKKPHVQNVEHEEAPSVKTGAAVRCDHTCPSCKCRRQPLSTAQSTCSFRTAPNDAPEGFLRLMDGQETGKFYVGASGFLKDDHYEVVIQLKKRETEKTQDKDMAKADSKTQDVDVAKANSKTQDVDVAKANSKTQDMTKAESKSQDVDVTKTDFSKNPEDSKIIVEDVNNLTKPDPNDAEESKDTEVQSFTVNVKESAVQTSIGDVGTEQQETKEIKPTEDKNVNTTFRDCLAVPDLPKSNPVRPATSACTQTSFSSPNSRPVFMHMTSSTSTAYMSPPDFITPQFLRRRASETDHYRFAPREGRKCRHVSSTTDTPPNTARNEVEETKRHRVCHKKHKHKSKSVHRGSSKSVRVAQPQRTAPKTPRHTEVKNVNPVVKKYVNKLLALNKEGLKAIQVINQDCSSVNTPSSSIINASCNVEKQASLDNKISLEQIKIMLEQQIVDDHAKRKMEKRPSDVMHSRCVQRQPRRVHKVKSLNISRRIFKKDNDSQCPRNGNVPSAADLTPDDSSARPKSRCKSSPIKQNQCHVQASGTESEHAKRHQRLTKNNNLRQHRATLNSTDSEKRDIRSGSLSHVPPTDSSHTSGVESEINFIKSAENKLQNMDRIADLTEKCMNRLSNLAKVLEEVRRNKSMVYSQISTSDTASETEPKVVNDRPMCQSTETEDRNENRFDLPSKGNVQKDFIPLFNDIPKPLTPSTLSLSTISEKSNAPSTSSDQTKQKARPPPALSRINLKTPDNFVIPHELSTVMEVDSPMSVKLKNQSSRQSLYLESAREPTVSDNRLTHEMQLHQDKNPIVQASSSKTRSKTPSLSSDDNKMEMMDMKMFNDIMLQPFVSLREYTKQCEVSVEDTSNVDEPLKRGGDVSSMHSDGSLPDVISELLKRKLISEPFKFDTVTASHLTTSISSESSLSLLALSKMYKAKRKSKHTNANKENLGETSETVSLSSNPDLENAFQKLGLGWASSTLKKTKERLALSSSSNTSSSSYSQLKFKSFNREPPTLATDSSELNDSNRSRTNDIKNAVQQTSATNSTIVRDFLTNELAKKITFTNQSSRNADEFVSLYETKMPDEIRDSPEVTKDGDQSGVSQSNNRARTSTPVQIFKSTTYHTSSSNTSNGLFSNADELSSVKVTSTSVRHHSTSDRDDLTIPNYSLKRKGSDNSQSA